MSQEHDNLDATTQRAMLNGSQPNPNLQIHRRGPNSNKRSRESMLAPGPAPNGRGSGQFQPSLTNHLVSQSQAEFSSATQQPFLSHAGCGTLSVGPLAQWMVQDGHYTKGYIQFLGAMINKIRLPDVQNSQFHPMYRTLDLLISALNNIRREMSFFEITATKYGIQFTADPPTHITRAYIDMFNSVSSPSASLLEGMVVLWATEHVRLTLFCSLAYPIYPLTINSWQSYRTAWMYASSFTSTLSGPTNENHIAALHQALIPNWTSPAFSKFVDACRSLVDELANSSTTANGKEEMLRCEGVFKQICWLQERFWPDVDGMGDEDDSGGRYEPTTFGGGSGNGLGGPVNGVGMNGGGMNGAGLGGPADNGVQNGPFGGALNRIGEPAGGATN
jgi:thiaminase